MVFYEFLWNSMGFLDFPRFSMGFHWCSKLFCFLGYCDGFSTGTKYVPPTEVVSFWWVEWVQA